MYLIMHLRLYFYLNLFEFIYIELFAFISIYICSFHVCDQFYVQKHLIRLFYHIYSLSLIAYTLCICARTQIVSSQRHKKLDKHKRHDESQIYQANLVNNPAMQLGMPGSRCHARLYAIRLVSYTPENFPTLIINVPMNKQLIC